MPPGLPLAVIVTGQPGEYAVCRRGALPVLDGMLVGTIRRNLEA